MGYRGMRGMRQMKKQITGFLEMLIVRMNASGEAASEPAAAQ
jgi:hypothetical protein